MNVETRLCRTVAERQLVQPGEHILVACSGGADSFALLWAMHRRARRLGIALSVASVDHGLRAESAEEVGAVLAFAGAHGIDAHAVPVEVRRSASLQQAARQARYAALLTLLHRLGAHRLATGHTMDDQAETVLLRLLRGSGLRGLGGIAYRREERIIRPLLDCRRQAVRDYARRHRLPFLDDPSNADRRYQRTRLRHEVLPRLVAEDANVVPHLAALAEESRLTAEHLQQDMLRRTEGLLERTQVPMQALLDLPAALRSSFFVRWIANHCALPLLRTQQRALLHSLAKPAEILLANGWSAVAHDGVLRLHQNLDRQGHAR